LKRPSASSLEAIAIYFAAVAVIVLRWAWRASHRGGYPLFSWDTFKEIEPILGALTIGTVILWVFTRTKGPNE
jgi:hypothetical protein